MRFSDMKIGQRFTYGLIVPNFRTYQKLDDTYALSLLTGEHIDMREYARATMRFAAFEWTPPKVLS